MQNSSKRELKRLKQDNVEVKSTRLRSGQRSLTQSATTSGSASATTTSSSQLFIPNQATTAKAPVVRDNTAGEASLLEDSSEEEQLHDNPPEVDSNLFATQEEFSRLTLSPIASTATKDQQSPSNRKQFTQGVLQSTPVSKNTTSKPTMVFTAEQQAEIQAIIANETRALATTVNTLRNANSLLTSAVTSLESEIQSLTAELAAEKATNKMDALIKALQAAALPGAASTNIKPPTFDSLRVNGDTYLADLEVFLQASGFKPDKYITVVKSFLPEECKSWFVAHSADFTDWDAFKNGFKARYDSSIQNAARMKRLLNHEQELTEPTEEFVYATLDLAKNCYPGKPEEEMIELVHNVLHWRIRRGIGAHTFKKVTELMAACERATLNEMNEDRENRRPIGVPYMRASDKPKQHQRNRSSSWSSVASSVQQQNSTPATYGRGRGRRGRGRFQRGRGRGRVGFREGASASSEQKDKKEKKTKKTDEKPSTSGSYKDKLRNPSSKQQYCSKCGGVGHLFDKCPSVFGGAMYVGEDDSDSSDLN